MNPSRHPISAAYNDMAPEIFSRLVDRIKEQGQLEPIILYNDMVLDGWHRYLACKQLGIPCNADEYSGNDPVGYVKAKHTRRPMTASQMAAVEVILNQWYIDEAARKGELSSPSVKTVQQMADAAGVSDRTIQQAKKALAGGIIDQVQSGEISAKEAAKRLTPPKEEPVTEGEPSSPPEEMVSMTASELEELHAIIDEGQARLETFEKMIDSDDKLSAAAATIQQQQYVINDLKIQLETALNKNNAMITIIKGKDKQIKKLEKENYELREESLPI